MWDSTAGESSEVIECTSLISNNFTLNSGGCSIDQRHVQSRSLSEQRRQNAEPHSLDYNDIDTEDEDINCENEFNDHISYTKDELSIDKDELSIDDISFYGNQNSPQAASSSRSRRLSPLALNNDGLLSPESSPKKFKVTLNGVTMYDKRYQIEEEEEEENDGIDRIESENSYSEKFSVKYSAVQQLFRSQKFDVPSCKSSLNFNGEQSNTTLLDSFGCQEENVNRKNDKKIKKLPNSFKAFNSLSSTESVESMEDDYMDLYDVESLENETPFPSNLKSLISGHIKSTKLNATPEIKRPVIRRCLSMQENNKINLIRGSLFESSKSVEDSKVTILPQQNERCFKRPEPPTASLSPLQVKRYKTENNDKENEFIIRGNLEENYQLSLPSHRSLLRKSMSMNDAEIALARSSNEPDLIGDFSKPFCLPLMEGRHQDLKSISSDTMAKLIQGEFKDNVASFKIIDCRYPYEYDGGHIRGAENLYTQEQILDELVNCKTESPTLQADGPTRHILVFHCEFSSERGPKLSRFLRNHDRIRNSLKYPALHYPEIYLLHGGYKEFFEKYSNLCDPASYRPMLDPSFCAAYRQFRAKSKSWNGDTTRTIPNVVSRCKKSRSRLVL